MAATGSRPDWEDFLAKPGLLPVGLLPVALLADHSIEASYGFVYQRASRSPLLHAHQKLRIALRLVESFGEHVHRVGRVHVA